VAYAEHFTGSSIADMIAAGAESQLTEALDQFSAQPGGTPWKLNAGDGAFYGPKIDVVISDSLKREWQCATIQLDFQQPQNFNLQYVSGEGSDAIAKKEEEKEAAAEAAPAAEKAKATDSAADSSSAAPALGPDGKPVSTAEQHRKELSAGYARPVMIHRAMAGSLERFIALLTEHFAGKWPFWLSPRQILVIPVGKGFLGYADEVRQTFKDHGMWVEVDTSGNTLQKKIRTGQLAQWNFIFVVGAEEQSGRQVNVRNRDDTATQDRGKPISLDEAVEKLVKLKGDRGMYNPFPPTKHE
jgi:threonyl-tRNA synthetase